MRSQIENLGWIAELKLKRCWWDGAFGGDLFEEAGHSRRFFQNEDIGAIRRAELNAHNEGESGCVVRMGVDEGRNFGALAGRWRADSGDK